jgi:nitrous oxidase accessory protein NosD
VKKMFSILFALVLMASPGLMMAAPVLADGNIRHVPGDYDTIQEAIDAASDNDTIIVAAGLYEESIVIDKALTLKGTQAGVDARTRSGTETVIEPDAEEAGISITTTDGRVVVIDGLTVQNGAHGIINSEYVEAGLGVKADITVKNVRVLNPGEFGISLTFTINATVEHCYVENAEIAINAGAVMPTPPTNATFKNNEVVNSRFGISGYLKGSLIEGNLIRDFSNGDLGVGISCQCLNTTIKNNTITGYVKGTALTFEKSHHDRPSSENVTVIGNNFTGNRHGIHVFDTQETLTGITVNFNNIDNVLSGVSNDKDQTLNAARNWWGDASGPLHPKLNRDGTGDTVSDNVDFEPWLGAPLVTVDTETATNRTIDATDQADTEIVVNGTATVTVAQYADNPGDTPTCFASLHKYIDVYIPDTTEVTEVEIRLYYTDAEVKDFDQESLRLFSWNGTAWVQCSDSGVNTTSTNGYSGYIWAEIRGDTTPTLAQLTGTPFGGYCSRFLEFSIATLELPSGKEKVAYEVELEACMGAEPYTWAITQGSLPDGLGLDADTGIISGTPTRADVFDFTVTVTDAAQIAATAELSITIKPPCFIAAAAYGTDTARGIDILREFRDEVLLPDRLGASVVSLYYQVSPPIANFISRHEVLRTVVRVGFVDPIVAILNWSHDLWSARNLQ